jgi:hypothetical protein
MHWVISSLNQQVDNPFQMTIKIAASKKDPFRADLDTMKATFPKLNILITDYDDSVFNARGKTRTDNIKNCTSEWILFGDADNVFHPQFFSGLMPLLSNLNANDKKKLISVPRLTMDSKTGNSLVNSNIDFKTEIQNSYKNASSVKTRLSFGGRVSGAGYMQLVNYPTMCQMGIDTYVNGSYDSSILDKNKTFKTKSDIVFRKKFDGIIKVTDLPLLIHLNHFRRVLDGEYDFNKCN